MLPPFGGGHGSSDLKRSKLLKKKEKKNKPIFECYLWLIKVLRVLNLTFSFVILINWLFSLMMQAFTDLLAQVLESTYTCKYMKGEIIADKFAYCFPAL